MAPPPTPPPHLLPLLMVAILTVAGAQSQPQLGGGSWCVARSDASAQALQTALDYACGAGADCLPLQPNGLCFLPNTIQAHASFAFDSYFQRKSRAPGSCDFAGTATIAQTDPSYGSCVYPSSASTAGGGTNTPNLTPPMTNPNVPTTTPTSPVYGGGGLTPVTPGMNSPMPDENSRAPSPSRDLATSILVFLCPLLFLFIIF